MERFFTDYWSLLETVYADMAKAVEGLPPEALGWSPGGEMNTLTVLVAHTLGSTRYWIGDVGAGAPSNRDRAAEFRTAGLDAEQLANRIQASLEEIHPLLAGITLADLGTERRPPDRERSYSVGWALAHALEHAAVHLGHMQVTRQLWEQRNG